MTQVVVKDSVVVFVGGCYGNLPALRAFFAEMEALGVGSRQIINTGDSVAYCADPQAVVQLLRARGVASVMGNCEESIGNGAEDCGCGYVAGGACDLLSQQWHQYCAAALDAETKEYFRGLPRRIELHFGSRCFWVVHGGVRRINRFLFYSSPQDQFDKEFASFSGSGIVGGHAGIPFTRIINRCCWHNSGALGMPANDGTPRVWYSVMRAVPDGVRFEHRALDYDYQAAADRIEQTPQLPNAYATALRAGRWPGMDILPSAERAAAGRSLSLAPQTHYC